MKRFLISIFAVFCIVSSGYSAQLVIDQVEVYTTPQAMMQAIDDNFDELYGWTGQDLSSTATPTFAGVNISPSASPGITPNDSDAPGADKQVGFMGWQYVDGADGAENSDCLLQIIQGGTLTTIVNFDESDDQIEVKKNLNLEANNLDTTGYISGKANTHTDTSGAITITVNAINYGTDTGDADIPDGACDAAGDVGNWVVLISSAADAYSLTSNDASNQFIITDNASALTAGNELDVDGTMVCVICIAAELWKVTGYMGTLPTDGGAAD